MLLIKSIIFAITLPFFFTGIGPAFASQQVTLAWDAVAPAPTGYRIYMHTANEEYPADPVWEGNQTTCTVPVPDGTEVAFVARAYVVGGISGDTAESADSNEITYMAPPDSPKNLLLQAIEQLTAGLQALKQALLATN